MKLFTFDEGFEEILRRIDETKERPFLISIHGPPESGKTTLSQRVLEQMKRKGEQWVRFEDHFDKPRVIEQALRLSAHGCAGFIFNDVAAAAWRRNPKELARYERGVRSISGRPIDLYVGIQNPLMYAHNHLMDFAWYDLVIANAASTKR